jgi:ABC-2 type transport system permease protein
MTDQVIYDRGYRSYDGPRRGAAGARRAVYREGIRRLLGLGRKARTKIFPWSLMTVAMVQALVFVGIAWAIGEIAEAIGQGVPTYGELFDFYSWIAVIFIAFAGPTLLIPDREKGVLSIYFSRPLTVDGYLGAKFGAFATIVGAIYIVPQVILHLGLALIAREGFLPYLGGNLDVMWKVPAVTLAFTLLHGGLVFGLSSVIKRPGIAAAAFLGVITAGGAIAAQVARANFPGARWLSLLNLDQHPRIIRDELFNPTVDHPAQIAGFGVEASVIVIAAVFLLAVWFVRWRYRRLA